MSCHRHYENRVVRPLADGDALRLHATVRASIASLSYAFPWCHPGYSLADAQARIAHCIDAWQRRTEFAFGIFSASSEALLGCVGLNQIDRASRSANLGYWVGAPYRGRGVATTAASLAASIGFEELGFVRLEIVVLTHNAASQRVAEKLGATREALARDRLVFQGQPADAIVYSLKPGDIAASESSG